MRGAGTWFESLGRAIDGKADSERYDIMTQNG